MKRLPQVLAVVAVLVTAMPAVSSPAPGCAPAAHAGGDWPSYGHDVENTRHQHAETTIGPGEAATLRPAWTFSARAAGGEGDFTGTPVVSDGCLYVGSNAGWIFAMNADDGSPVWSRQLDEGSLNNSLAVHDGTLYAYASVEGAPYVIALDAATGDHRWTTIVDTQPGSDAFASPVVLDGLVFVGVSGDAAQHGDEGERITFHGSYVLLDAQSGAIEAKTYTIPEADWDDGFAGGTVTTTPAYDASTKRAYVGTGSPFRPQFEHPRANALLQIDLDRASPTFGEILATYKGDTFDDVLPGYSSMPCTDLPLPPPPAIVPTGRGIGACGDVDVDFAASPNLYRLDGETRIADAQKSGAVHAVEASAMDARWRTTVAPAQPFGGVSGAYDGTSLYGGAAPPGQLFALDPADGSMRWMAPVADGAHYGIPVASANGVVYTLDAKGFLDAYDAADGSLLLARRILAGTDAGPDATPTFGGVSVARNTVYAAVGAQNTGLDFAGLLNGYVVAFRPAQGENR